MDEWKQHGKVYLVGAGPGDPDLITVKAQRVLNNCDVIVYDALVNSYLLNTIPPQTRLIFVGESRSSKRFTQEEINELIIFEASVGNTVVRLKGGDPFVFGRGGEEAVALNAAGINWEIIPGITSGIAVPAYSGIPLTHRGIASSAAFLTGHECIGPNTSVDIRKIALSADTLVIFMGSRNLKTIAEKLLSAGMKKTTPVAVIEKGTLPDQRTTVFKLENISNSNRRFETPALIIVGDCVNLREKILKPEQVKTAAENNQLSESEDELLPYLS